GEWQCVLPGALRPEGNPDRYGEMQVLRRQGGERQPGEPGVLPGVWLACLYPGGTCPGPAGAVGCKFGRPEPVSALGACMDRKRPALGFLDADPAPDRESTDRRANAKVAYSAGLK